MKIKFTKETTYCFDEVKELKRLKQGFRGTPLKRQLDIFNSFLNNDLKEVEKLYAKLPYSDKYGCPEQEFVGAWYEMLHDNANWMTAQAMVKEESKVELFKE